MFSADPPDIACSCWWKNSLQLHFRLVHLAGPFAGSKKVIDPGLRIVGHSIRPRLSRRAKGGPRKASNNCRRYMRHRSTVRPAGCCMSGLRPHQKLLRSSCRFPGSCSHGETHMPPSHVCCDFSVASMLVRDCRCMHYRASTRTSLTEKTVRAHVGMAVLPMRYRTKHDRVRRRAISRCIRPHQQQLLLVFGR